MFAFISVIHVIICLLLLTVVLMQSGRGGGLTEGFASTESMFGAQTNSFMIKVTTVMATIFLVTCLSLAFISSKRESSIMPTQAVSTSLPTTTLADILGEDLSVESIPEVDVAQDEIPPIIPAVVE